MFDFEGMSDEQIGAASSEEEELVEAEKQEAK